MTFYNSPREKQRVQALNRKIWLRSNAYLLIIGVIALVAFIIAGIMDTSALQQGVIQ